MPATVVEKNLGSSEAAKRREYEVERGEKRKPVWLEKKPCRIARRRRFHEIVVPTKTAAGKAAQQEPTTL